MAGRLSFSIAINLFTENFRKGSNQVKAAFRSMQMQILTFAAALGAGGIGLSNLVSRFIDGARETNRVTTALKNVSGGTAQFADNQRYLLDLAKKYGMEINALTASYAKFTAAASISDMSMMDQRKIFESVSRACTAFGMSADDSNGVMLALSQMMSKGKISSEELRLQMGERLPVALQAMAKAAGVSVADLDKLMKQGQLMSKDMLPKFAEALNEMIPNVDTDNLETSVNHLKNAFTELVNGADVQSKYKSLIDWLTGAIQGLGENLKNILTLAFAGIVFVATSAATKVWRGWSSAYDSVAASGERASAQAIRATERRVAIEGTLAVKKKVESAALAEYQVALANGTAQEVIAAEIRKDRAVRARIAAESSLEKARAAEQKALDKQKQLSATTAAMGAASGWKKANIIIGAQIKRLGTSLLTMGKAFLPAILISGIIAVVGYFKNLREEAQRIRGIFKDYKKQAVSIQPSTEVSQLEALRNIANDVNRSTIERKNALEEVAKRLNIIKEKNETEINYQKRINDKIKDRIKLLEESARADFYAQQKVTAEHEFKKFKKDLNLQGMPEPGMNSLMTSISKYKDTGSRRSLQDGIDIYAKQIRKSGGEFVDDYQDKLVEMSNYWQIMTDSSKELASAVNNSLKLDDKKPLADDDGSEKKTPLQKAEEDYRSSLQKYKNQLDAGAITQEQFDQEIDKLNSDTVVKLGGILGKSANANETYAKALLGTLNPRITESVKAQTELNKVQEDYKKAANLAKAKLDKKLISEDEYRQALVEAAIAAANSAISIENIGDAADGFIKKMRGIVGDNLRIDMPKIGKRDTTFDYKKTDVDKKTEELDIWIKYKDDLREKFEEAKKAGSDTAKSLEIELNSAIANVDNLEDALKLAQVQEDIKNFNKELNESLYSGIKDIASSSDRVVSAFQNLNEVMNDVDASEWEKIMAIWNTLTTVVDSFLSIIKMIENITELTNRLSAAQKAESVVEQQVSNQKIINAAKEMAVDTTAAETKKSNSRGVVAANTAEAATAAGKSVAGIPFVGIAMAAAAVAGIIALFATLPKFAKGGIIGGGPSSGDKILARVNAGEMILNQGQQSNLFKAINSGKLGNANNSSLSSTVTTKVRAKDIILAINNELKSQGKKTIS